MKEKAANKRGEVDSEMIQFLVKIPSVSKISYGPPSQKSEVKCRKVREYSQVLTGNAGLS